MSGTLLICYDRPSLAALCLEVILQDENPLYLFADGGASPSFQRLFEETRLARKEKKTYIRIEKENLGPRDGPWEAIKWMLKAEGSGIILEEDLQPDPNFLEFYRKGLSAFAEDKSVAALGSAPKELPPFPGEETWARSPLFLVWGWATWWDRIADIDIPHQLWSEKRKTLLSPLETFAGKLYLEREFDQLKKNPHFCWSYYPQQIFLEKKQHVLIPRAKFTTNLGIGINNRRTRHGKADGKISQAACAAAAQKPATTKPYSKEYQRAIEREKFGGIIQELRNRIQIRSRVKSIIKSFRFSG